MRADLAILRGANLSGAQLEEAVFSNATIEQAVFKGTSGLSAVSGMDTTEGRDFAVFD